MHTNGPIVFQSMVGTEFITHKKVSQYCANLWLPIKSLCWILVLLSLNLKVIDKSKVLSWDVPSWNLTTKHETSNYAITKLRIWVTTLGFIVKPRPQDSDPSKGQACPSIRQIKTPQKEHTLFFLPPNQPPPCHEAKTATIVL